MGAFIISCNQQPPLVPPLSIDIPASYRTDSAAWRFMNSQTAVWKDFGKKVESMYQKGEKFKQKNFFSLSQREMVNLLKLDNAYAELWLVQIAYLGQMDMEAERAAISASKEGVSKIIEVQKIVYEYYRQLVNIYGMDLKLDKDPLLTSPIQEDSLSRVRYDSIINAKIDSVLLQFPKIELPELPAPPDEMPTRPATSSSSR